VGNLLLCWLLLTGIGTLVVRKDIEHRGLVLLAVLHALVVFVAYNLALSPYADIRVDLLLTVPLVLVIIGWGVARASRRGRSDADQMAPPPGKRTRR
jgi:hypothetical protein